VQEDFRSVASEDDDAKLAIRNLDEDIYGDQTPASHTPAQKKRKISSQSATPISKTSTVSGIFTPGTMEGTPASSVYGSTRTPGSRKRALADFDISDFEVSQEDSDDEFNDEDESVAEVSPPQAAQPTPNRTVPYRRGRFPQRLSQWERTNLALITYHPELINIWEILESAPQIVPVAVPQPDGLSLQLLPFQREGLDWLLKQEQQDRFSGGILADEMGMGKTIQTIALLLAEPRGKPNLVIAPAVAMMQWKQEIETHTNNGLSVYLFYSSNRSISHKELIKYDVVITTCAARTDGLM
jgi:SNF2 family DNA or RNA helicase